jgi:hypothetical protein
LKIRVDLQNAISIHFDTVNFRAGVTGEMHVLMIVASIRALFVRAECIVGCSAAIDDAMNDIFLFKQVQSAVDGYPVNIFGQKFSYMAMVQGLGLGAQAGDYR